MASDLCLSAAQYAADQTGVPIEMLIALSLVETGRTIEGQMHPWAWALNRDGDSVWPASREEAEAVLLRELAAGVTNIDVGCFQVNFRWHGTAFVSPEAMLDPFENALYAAGYLRRLAGEGDDWVAAAGAYHSQTPELAERYLARLLPIYDRVMQAGVTLAAAEARPSDNGFPLLQRGKTGGAGSIVPLGSASRPLIGGP